MGLRIREIKTTITKAGETVPVLDEHGQEIELWAVDVPLSVEAQGPAAVDAYVAAQRAKTEPPDDDAPGDQGEST